MLTPVISNEPDLRFALRPNCLITRRPLVFLTPPRSLFYYKNSWAEISHILYEHGYKVEIFQLPYQNINEQKKVLKNDKIRIQNAHLLMDSVTFENLKTELTVLTDSTITVISTVDIQNVFYFKPQFSKSTLNYFLHRIWCKIWGLKTPDFSELLIRNTEKNWHSFLDHCVHLAEIDYSKD